jgi:hypothetical protein
VQFERPGLERGRRRQFDGGARHFKVGDGRQDLLPAYPMVSQEELGAGKHRCIALARQVRGIGVQQGMEHGDATGSAGLGNLVDPVLRGGERIARQSQAARLVLPVEPVPVEIEALGPQFRELGELPARQPFFQRFSEVLVLQQLPCRLVAFRLAVECALAVPFAGNEGRELAAQVGRGIDQESDAFLHRFTSRLQGVGQRLQIGPLIHGLQHVPRPLLQLLRRLGRQGNEHAARAARRMQRRHVFLHQDMRIGPARAER